jgi:hypothetical protein
MMEKFAQTGQGGDAHPPPFSIYLLFTITYKVAVYSPAERADTVHLYFISIPMYSVVLLAD